MGARAISEKKHYCAAKTVEKSWKGRPGIKIEQVLSTLQFLLLMLKKCSCTSYAIVRQNESSTT